jgi:hypothetical protein
VLWRKNAATSVAAAETGAVPEPSSASLAGIITLLFTFSPQGVMFRGWEILKGRGKK